MTNLMTGTMLSDLHRLVETAEEKALAKRVIADQEYREKMLILIEMYEKAFCRGCGLPNAECECEYDPRVELYDDPARGTR